MRHRALLAVLVASLLAPAVSDAAFPGANGKIAFVRANDIWTMNPDATNQVNLTNSPGSEHDPVWSPDGSRIAFDSTTGPSTRVYVMAADGTGVTPVTTTGRYDPTWAPDGTDLAYIGPGDNISSVYRINVDGTGEALLTGNASESPSWSPDGSRVALTDQIPFECPSALVTFDIETDPSYEYFQVTCTSWADNWPNWSPNGSRIAFASNTTCDGCDPPLLTTIDPDGTDRVTLAGVNGRAPAWSPDGGKIAYYVGAVPRIKIVNADGTNIVDLADGHSPDWQPIPINSYIRPKGATPLRVSLTTAYNQCTSPNRTHGPPLAFPSCAGPTKTSQHLTVGTGDSNGLPARNEGSVTLTTIVGAPGGPDDADVAIQVFMDDVFTNALADYAGELRAHVALRITDKDNTPSPGGPGAATTTEIPLDVIAPCTPVADPQEGSACSATTTADALAPGTVKESRRTIWQLGRVELYDGGADGDANTPAGDTLFATQGIFIP